jgi:hypothetical protein
MTNYSPQELYTGITSSNLLVGVPYTFTITNNSGSGYFVIETKFNYKFDGSTPKNLSGSFSSLNNITGIIKSDYVAGFVLPKGVSSFEFTPSMDISGSTLLLRGVGGVSLSVSEGAATNGSWNFISLPWNQISASWDQPIT